MIGWEVNLPGHNLIPVLQKLQPLFIFLLLDSWDEVICRDPVAPAAEDGYVVDLEEEASSRLILEFSLNHLNPADPDRLCHAINLVPRLVLERCSERVEGLRAVAVRVPQLRPGNGQGGYCVTGYFDI